MSTACRHCFPDDDDNISNQNENNNLDMTYMSSLVFGTEDKLKNMMKKIEQEEGVISGVSTWCERCKKCSIISYSLHVYMSKQSRCTDPIPSRFDYYSSMCDLAERLTGKKLGFSVKLI
jgi:hypothetical protein